MWAPSMGLTFSAISTTCKKTTGMMDEMSIRGRKEGGGGLGGRWKDCITGGKKVTHPRRLNTADNTVGGEEQVRNGYMPDSDQAFFSFDAFIKKGHSLTEANLYCEI